MAVTVTAESWEHYVRLYAEEISQGGLFIRIIRPPPVGTILKVRIALPDHRTIELDARVADVIPPEQQLISGKKPGAAVRFVKWTDKYKTVLADLAAQHGGTPARAPTAAAPAHPRAPSTSHASSAGHAREPSDAVSLHHHLATLRMRDMHAVLGVKPDATPAQIRASFLKLSKRWHPDRFGLDSELRNLAAEIFMLIRKAYEKLNQPAAVAIHPGASKPVPAAPSPPRQPQQPKVAATAPAKREVEDGISVVSREAPVSTPGAAPARPAPAMPKNRDVLLGDKFMKAGRPDLARQAYARALSLDSGNLMLARRHDWACASQAINAGEQARAAEILKAAVARDPKFTEAITLLHELEQLSESERKTPRGGLLSKLFGETKEH